ncbi:hypothetical protein COCSADRAFT_24055 [Bipolaris sorokiniana ND90Pr]|uniref:Uncharacterized protein n=1 Tax=Cochliobolus sativus (strain ND90Pr / ATCC 201652) TaxID=665912 RepID=M2TEQ3_COCSN|nr:uncharacterized protein COCSADRAFT_24055 [Bipolaris sorokiniana ND90Pr]EMD67711.1 hypothetical protein COCSADRAFT_24055 [Bipolaris sorokiniana ND90Pr]
MGHQSTSGLFGTITKPPHLSQRTSGPRQPTKPGAGGRGWSKLGESCRGQDYCGLAPLRTSVTRWSTTDLHGWSASKCWAMFVRALAVLRCVALSIQSRRYHAGDLPRYRAKLSESTTAPYHTHHHLQCRYDLEYTQTRVRLRVSPSWPLAIQIVTFLRPLLAYPGQLGYIGKLAAMVGPASCNARFPVKHHPTMPP